MSEATPGQETPKKEASQQNAAPSNPAPDAAAAATPAAQPVTSASPAAPGGPHDAPAEAVAAGPSKLKAGLGSAGKFAKGALGGLKSAIVALVSLPLLLLRGDLLTKVLTAGLLVSVLLIGLTSVKLYQRFIHPLMPAKDSSSVASQGMNKFVEEQKQLAIAASNLVFLERFQTSIHSPKAKMGILEFELYVECDKPETSAVVRTKLAQLHEAISIVAQDQNYDDLIGDEGKDALKEKILKAVNASLKRLKIKGSIKNVYFTKFIMA
ncbi:MAG: flagellar basal body-associated FliL family protein [Bdellovibrionota bacterium]